MPSAAPGNLAFSSAFEGGNLGSVSIKQPREEYTVSIRHDTNNPNYRLWYHFQVSPPARKRAHADNCLLAGL